jgi:hypothetical protein
MCFKVVDLLCDVAENERIAGLKPHDAFTRQRFCYALETLSAWYSLMGLSIMKLLDRFTYALKFVDQPRGKL